MARNFIRLQIHPTLSFPEWRKKAGSKCMFTMSSIKLGPDPIMCSGIYRQTHC